MLGHHGHPRQPGPEPAADLVDLVEEYGYGASYEAASR